MGSLIVDDDEPDDEFHRALRAADDAIAKSSGNSCQNPSDRLENLLDITQVTAFCDIGVAMLEIQHEEISRPDGARWKKTLLTGLEALVRDKHSFAQQFLLVSYERTGIQAIGLALAFSYKQTSSFDRAVGIYDEMIENDPGNARIVWCKAECLERSGNRTAALTTLEAGLRHQDDSVSLWRYHALLLMNDGKYQRAVSSAKKASFYDEETASLFLEADLHARLSHFKAAKSCYDAIVDRDPLDPVGWFSRGITLLRLGKAADAQANFSSGLSHLPENASLYYGVGMASEQDGDLRRAKRFYQRCLELHNENPCIILRRLASVHHKLGESTQALYALRDTAFFDSKNMLGVQGVSYPYMMAACLK
ncbi:MAG TPA: tetratricopeptide repeat protein [Candidatus Nanoarchaeia archaeon]|nr:tetratricopeptide repeat protein [Candidatus Nanoarchaeia archaeon]